MAFPKGNRIWERSKGNLKHGLRHKRIYDIWRSMRQRCNNPNCKNYKNYGAKGIMVCDEWNDPEVFAKWAYENGYNDFLTIDRIDSNGNYEPSNCRWATAKEQQNNRGNNVLYKYRGEEHTLPEWSEIVHIKADTLWARINVSGMSVEEALSTPLWGKDTRFKCGNKKHG